MATEEKLWYPKLRGTINYRAWKKDMEAAFRSQDASTIVSGEQAKPPMPESAPGLLREEFVNQVLQPRGRNRPNREEINDQYDDYMAG